MRETSIGRLETMQSNARRVNKKEKSAKSGKKPKEKPKKKKKSKKGKKTRSFFPETWLWVIEQIKFCSGRRGVETYAIEVLGYEGSYDLIMIPSVSVTSVLKRPELIAKKSFIKTRTYFPETWIWTLFSFGNDGVSEEALNLPDTVTEWVGSAVCVHPSKGVGISNIASIVTFKEFFVDLTLPPSAKRGEIFPVKISIFNYLKESLPIRVILESPDAKFEILADSGETLGTGERTSCVPEEDKTVFSIRIRAKEVGDVNISVKAIVEANSVSDCGSGAVQQNNDHLIKPIRVSYEGFLKEETQSKYVCTEDLENSADALEIWNVKAPDSIVPDSARGFVAVVGDLMGPTLEYLDASNQNTANIANKAIEFMEKVDPNDLSISKGWLKSKQLENGCFESVGKVLHKGMKGGLSGSDSPSLLTSFVLISLIEAGESSSSTAVSEALFCINAAKPTTNPYSLAVKAYALALANSPDTQAALDQLLKLAKTSAGSLYWELPAQYGKYLKLQKSSKGVAVETASYAILALLTFAPNSSASTVDYLPQVRLIIKWINTQRNGQGGFISTQDTIIALQALAAFEKTVSQGPVDLTVLVTMGDVENSFTVNEQNKLLQQSVPFPVVPTSITFDIVGQGCVLLQSVLRYNVPQAEGSEAFSLKVTTKTEPDKGCKTKRIEVCSSYLLPDKKSNMAIIEIDLVSGYIPEKANLKQIIGYGTGLFKRYEVDGSKVTIYVDEFSPEVICVSLRILREIDVENPKPGTVKVYDYYKPEYVVSETYTLPPTTECLDEGEVFTSFEGEIINAVEGGGEQPAETTTTTVNLDEALAAFDEAIV
ncbi:Alpha-2-macroglobulin-like protein 1 [Armadillidium nasatum]|uniref:Alpha-2-macroglobulin-like protein 1 n=1 Tax=Armadillidium nasatum TaxID=96803 RepID=A0A5N5TPK2_9CRUS|nr:Alpha-2-macroglobulin-like protein 1 [Armadillidium nasatum]